MEVTDRLKAAWWTGVFLLVLGLAVSVFHPYACAPGLVVLSASAGMTAARGRRAGWWLVPAWAVPVLPIAAGVGVFAWLAHVGADPMAVVVLLVLGAAAVTVTWGAFLVALVVESARLTRRFVAPTPAWENGPPPPSYS